MLGITFSPIRHIAFPLTLTNYVSRMGGGGVVGGITLWGWIKFSVPLKKERIPFHRVLFCFFMLSYYLRFSFLTEMNVQVNWSLCRVFLCTARAGNSALSCGGCRVYCTVGTKARRSHPHTKTAFLWVCPVCEPPHVMPPDFLLYTPNHTYAAVIP